jgi:hypothetical protein
MMFSSAKPASRITVRLDEFQVLLFEPEKLRREILEVVPSLRSLAAHALAGNQKPRVWVCDFFKFNALA